MSTYDCLQIVFLSAEFCKDLYKQIQDSGVTGRLAWGFVKPLMQGTVLYSPANNATKVIMDEVGHSYMFLGQPFPFIILYCMFYFVFSIAVFLCSPRIVYCHLLMRRNARIPPECPLLFSNRNLFFFYVA